MSAIIVIAIVLGVAALVAIAVVLSLIHICPPNEVLVFAGAQRRVAERQRGYRLVQGGRGIRVPLLERVYRLDLTNMIIELRVLGAYSKGGIPLNVAGVANVKIASGEPAIGNAIERFLVKSREQIMAVAKETLEGNLRGVLATLTPEEVNQDRVKFAQSLLHEADHDLRRLGLELDTLKIQTVSDDKGYLDSLGRKQTAELLMRSRVAEAENQALAAERAAENLETQEIARLSAEIDKTRAQASRRIVEAETQQGALVAEAQANVTAAVARAQADVGVQRARLDQVRLQLEADHLRPAQARRGQMLEAARGAAAQIIEDGKARATALRSVAQTCEESGDIARQIFVAQKLPALVGQLMSTVTAVPIDKITVMDAGLGGGDGGGLAVKAAVAAEQLKHTVGVDVAGLLDRLGASRVRPPAPPAPPVRPPRAE